MTTRFFLKKNELCGKRVHFETRKTKSYLINRHDWWFNPMHDTYAVTPLSKVHNILQFYHKASFALVNYQMCP